MTTDRDASGERKIEPVRASRSASSQLSRVIEGAPNEVIIARVIHAPRELVFAAWTQADHLARWYGPEGFTITTHEIDVRTGGVWRFTMHGPDGVDYANRIVYVEVTPPERIVNRHSGDGGDGGDDEKIHFETTVTFTDLGGKTELRMCSVFPSAAERDAVVEMHGAIEGGKQTLGRLADLVEPLATR